MEVSVRELQANLYAVLRQVEAGKSALIASHRTPAARLVPPPAQGDSLDDRLIAAGLMTERAEPGPLVGGVLKPLPPGVGSLSDAIIEDRG